MYYTDHFIKKCGQIFSLPQSVYKTEVGRVKVNRTNYHQNRPIKPDQVRTKSKQELIETKYELIE